MLRARKIGHFFLAGMILVFTVPTAERAASRLTEDLTEILKIAQAAVQVTVTEQHVQSGTTQGMTFTVITLNVEKVYKGEIAAGSHIQAEYAGGGSVIAPGQAKLSVGDRAVLMLYKAPAAVTWRVLGGDAGQISLTVDGEGRQIARRGSGQFEFFVADESRVTGYRPVKLSAIRTEQLETLLQTVIETGRPVLEKPQTVTVLSTTPAVAAAPIEAKDDSIRRAFVALIATTLVWAAMRRRAKLPRI